jgi:DNA-binding NtrC family response regulator
LHLPPLRERREDIPLLVRHYVAHYAEQLKKPVPEVAEDVQTILMRHDWPGNIRQMMNVVQSMVVIAEGDKIEPRHLPAEVRDAGGGEVSQLSDTGGMSLDQIEKKAIRDALRVTAGNREQAAQMLGIGERTLYRKLKEYGLK